MGAKTYIRRNNFNYINQKLNKIMATQAEELQELKDLKTQSDKATAKIIAKIATLEAAVTNAGDVSPEVSAALDDLKASVGAEDAVVPDTTTP